jgi:zinc protease
VAPLSSLVAGEGATPPALRLHGPVTVSELANGLTVCVVENPRAPLVSTALWFRVGTRDEDPRQLGTAHFLEHMMFKGSAGFGPGEIDRLTQALGGANNAFTSHDATAYHFDFASDRFATALAIEADRMAGLLLDPGEVASERQVVVEEIAMYEDDPWDALELAVHAEFFGDHPYGRSVLGSAETLARVGPEELAAFHRRFYGPDNAILVLAGDVEPAVLGEVERRFGHLPARGRNPPRPQQPAAGGSAAERPSRRLERRFGDVARCMVMLPAPSSPSAEHAALRFVMAVLAVGRASRLQRALVDEGELCSWIHADISDSGDAAAVSFAFELLPGVAPERAEEALWRELAALVSRPVGEEEAARVRRVLLADWYFGHESIHQQAIGTGAGMCLFALGHAEQLLQQTLATEVARLPELAARWLDRERGACVGWSLPEEG